MCRKNVGMGLLSNAKYRKFDCDFVKHGRIHQFKGCNNMNEGRGGDKKPEGFFGAECAGGE